MTMAARDRFELDLTCPQCGATGTAQVSEDDYPFMRSPHFRIDEIPAGFVMTKAAATRHETEAMCSKCKVPFRL